MNIHTRLVGAFYATILSFSAVATLMMGASLLDASFAQFETPGKRGTVTIQQLAVEENTVTVRHM